MKNLLEIKLEKHEKNIRELCQFYADNLYNLGPIDYVEGLLDALHYILDDNDEFLVMAQGGFDEAARQNRLQAATAALKAETQKLKNYE